MAVVRVEARVVDERGGEIGAGMAAIHLPLGRSRAQQASGTVSLRQWNPAGGDPVALCWGEGESISIQVSRDAISDCSRNRILRFSASWQPTDGS